MVSGICGRFLIISGRDSSVAERQFRPAERRMKKRVKGGLPSNGVKIIVSLLLDAASRGGRLNLCGLPPPHERFYIWPLKFD